MSIEKFLCPRTGESCADLNNPDQHTAALFFSMDIVEPTLCEKYLDSPRYPDTDCGFQKLVLFNHPPIQIERDYIDGWSDPWPSIRGPDSLSDEQRDVVGGAL